jgi:hypothetical protein
MKPDESPRGLNLFATLFLAAVASEKKARTTLATGLIIGGENAVLGAALGFEALSRERTAASAPYRSALNALFAALCETPDSRHLGILSRLLPQLERSDHWTRWCAARIASQQPRKRVLSGLKGKFSDGNDFIACLLQELVLHGRPTAIEPELRAMAESSRAAGHPLGWLSLELTAIEGFLSYPHNSAEFPPGQAPSWPAPDFGSLIHATRFPMHEMGPEMAVDYRANRAPAATEAEALTRRAFDTWIEVSNGKVVYRLSEGAGNGPADPEWLPSLDLDCLKGASLIEVREVTPSRVFTCLFGPSAGGAYGPGIGSAYGRLFAWQSLAGLCGLGPEATQSQVLEAALNIRWYSFDAESAWFYHVAWDVGLVAARPDGTHVVLAATDTD